MAYLLYEKTWQSRLCDDQQVKVFTPKPGRLFMPAEEKSAKATAARFLFWLMTWGKAKIYYIAGNDGEIQHTSYVLPKCAKFPFMEKGSFEIGPCQTAEKFRGQGLYGKVLSYITSEETYKNARFYMIVEEQNKPSVRGIEKAGFVKSGTIKRTKYLKRYKKCT